MDDQGFDFRKSVERKEPRAFEPPPWEQDAFQQLQRKRTEEDEPTGETLTEAPPAAPEPAAVPPEAAPAAKATGPSEAEVLELLAGLRAEEPDSQGPATQLTIGATVVLLPIGLMLLVWGMAALVKAGSSEFGKGIAMTVAATMLMFGAGFIATAFWLVYRLMKRRGVL